MTASRTPLELWGGAECTVNRVGESYRDQTRLSGHQDRPADLDLFASLGIVSLRYPVLWERVAPDRPDAFDWRWSDERVARIARLGMRPIVGLVHHGSGPRYTSLVSDSFAPLLGRYAAAVAARYPDVRDWTPVNEPLTTARFSALYGHWYPHARDERLFWLALLNQIDGTRAAMAAIRAINPAARLIQTEDLGRCYATAPLAGVAEHNNHRRWMTWDLLAGRVGSGHPLWPHLVHLGFGERLRAIADDPCPADMLGVNHYVTSDRFLDDRPHGHAAPMPPEGYHDVTAARVLDPPPAGLSGALREAWARYRTPLAVTESHLNCTREEQVRWQGQAWRDCLALIEEGVDVRALTAWALLGSIDWDSLLTRADGHYEPGAFDIRDRLRRTATGALLAALGGTAPAPAGVTAALAGTGWWHRALRLEHPPHRTGILPIARIPAAIGAPVLIAGATGPLGRALARACAFRGLRHVVTDRATLPPDDAAAIAATLDRYRPWAVIDATGWVRVDEAEDGREDCHAADAAGAGNLAQACAARGIHLTLVSSDLAFDATDAPYAEAATPTPLGADGRSEADAERRAAEAGGRVLVVRTAALFSPDDPHSFAAEVERTLRAGYRFVASPDHVVTPAYLPDLVQACLDLVVDEATDTWHLTHGEAVSWLGFARRIAQALALDPRLIVAGTPGAPGWGAARPRDAALLSTRGALLPSLDDAIGRYAAARRREALDDSPPEIDAACRTAA